jgi:hypothetical protein
MGVRTFLVKEGAKMKRFYVIITGVILILTLQQNSSLAFKNEPDGFRGVKWGTSIDSLKGMIYFGKGELYGGYEVYLRRNEDLRVGDARLNSVLYAFWQKKLFSVTIFLEEGISNWSTFKETIFEKFGAGYQPNRYIEDYRWYGDITNMILVYDEISEEGNLMMTSKKITIEQKEYAKRKAKEGAEKGF